ncbi:IS110 family transposase, partial [Salegentibacter sp. JZCK2]|nr:IS110 family transposase [Salegentibacter tibetensis]
MMNIRLKEVLSQVHGASGLKIIRAILAGERNPDVLVEMCHRSVLKTKRELIVKSLKGHYNEAGLFA